MAELRIVARSRLGSSGPDAADAVLDAAHIVTVPVDGAIAAGALRAWDRFGRGRHPARSNFGDGFSYATADHYEVPLLCVGADFAQTDLRIIDVLAG